MCLSSRWPTPWLATQFMTVDSFTLAYSAPLPTLQPTLHALPICYAPCLPRAYLLRSHSMVLPTCVQVVLPKLSPHHSHPSPGTSVSSSTNTTAHLNRGRPGQDPGPGGPEWATCPCVFVRTSTRAHYKLDQSWWIRSRHVYRPFQPFFFAISKRFSQSWQQYLSTQGLPSIHEQDSCLTSLLPSFLAAAAAAYLLRMAS